MTLKSGMKGAMAAAIALMVISSSFVVLMTGPSARAAMAGLDEGDKWALVGEKDITLDYDSLNALFTFGNWEEDWYRNATLEEAYFHGAADSVAVFEVIDVTADHYVIEINAVQNFSLRAKIMLNAELVVPGEYITDWNSITSSNPQQLKNISEAETASGLLGGEIKMAMGMSEKITLTVNKVNMTIAEMEMDASMYLRSHVAVNNYPNDTAENYNSTTKFYSVNITEYNSFVSDISLDLDLNASMTFEPYLQILANDVAVGDHWHNDCYMNGTLNWEGMLNATGLPEELTSNLFTNETAKWGITGFPIDLAAIYNPESTGPQIDNGTFAFNTTISPKYYNLENATIKDPVFGDIFVNKFGFSDSLTWTYCPANGAIVRMALEGQLGSVNIKLDMVSAPITEANELMDTITQQIEDKAAYDELTPEVVVPPVDDDDDDDGNNTDTNGTVSKGNTVGLDVTIIVVVIAAALSVVAGFFVGSRMKPKA